MDKETAAPVVLDATAVFRLKQENDELREHNKQLRQRNEAMACYGIPRVTAAEVVTFYQQAIAALGLEPEIDERMRTKINAIVGV